MIRAQDLKGVVAMMPAFTTPDGDRLMRWIRSIPRL